MRVDEYLKTSFDGAVFEYLDGEEWAHAVTLGSLSYLLSGCASIGNSRRTRHQDPHQPHALSPCRSGRLAQ